MAVDVKVLQNIDNKYVKIEATSTHAPTRYFKVPQENADSFCTNYKREAKKNTTRNYVAMFVSVLAACGITGIFTKSFNKTAQTISGIVAGIAGLAGATYYSTKRAISNEEKMLQQLNANEIFKEKKELPI